MILEKLRVLSTGKKTRFLEDVFTFPRKDNSRLLYRFLLVLCSSGLVSFVFYLRSCGVVCDGNYSSKIAQGSGRRRPRKLGGRISFAEGCGRGCW